MDVGLFKHWMPDLKGTTNKRVYVARQCPFCTPVPRSKSFRLNLKLKVWKCYQCGRGGKSFNKFIHYLKGRGGVKFQNRYLKRIGRYPKCIPIGVYYGCETQRDSLLPF